MINLHMIACRKNIAQGCAGLGQGCAGLGQGCAGLGQGRAPLGQGRAPLGQGFSVVFRICEGRNPCGLKRRSVVHAVPYDIFVFNDWRVPGLPPEGSPKIE